MNAHQLFGLICSSVAVLIVVVALIDEMRAGR